MNLRHAAALALVGWYLMVPLDLNAGNRAGNQKSRVSSDVERADHERAKSSADIVDGYLDELARNPDDDLVWTRATALLLGTDILNFSSRLMHLCFGPDLPSSETRKRDCEDLGLKLLSLKQTVLRTAFEREWRMSAQERQFSDQLEAALRRDTEKINPIEVQEKTRLLRAITADLDKPAPDPAYVFMAGEQTSKLSRFILAHCPGQLIWGMSNGSATEECRGLEKAILDFQRAVVKVTSKEPQSRGR